MKFAKLFSSHAFTNFTHCSLQVPWRCVIVDEAHRLRNVNSKLLECMRSVVTKGALNIYSIVVCWVPLPFNVNVAVF